MASILIRNLDDETKDRLRLLAARHRRPLEAEVREILRYSVMHAQRLEPDSYAPVFPDRNPPPATDQEPPLAARSEVPFVLDEAKVIADTNRLLVKMGLSELMLPENPPPG